LVIFFFIFSWIFTIFPIFPQQELPSLRKSKIETYNLKKIEHILCIENKSVKDVNLQFS
jgi:hypothetical protein